MNIKIVNDRAVIDGQPVNFIRSPNQGGRITPRLLVLHDTAGPTADGAISWFLKPAAKASAHFIVARDGAVTQMVECDRSAWHAGKSTWRGASGCNGYSIGIEIVNPGLLDKAGALKYGKRVVARYDPAECVAASSPAHGSGLWLPYSAEQMEAVTALSRAICAAYGIDEMVGHYDISPGRKVDVGPHFPWDAVRSAALGAQTATRAARVATEAATGILRMGSTGPAVTALQRRLGELGFAAGSADGIFGARTRAAVLAFQAENKLQTDGVAGPATRAALDSEAAKSMPTGAREELGVADLAGTSRIVAGAQRVTTAGRVVALVSGVTIASGGSPDLLGTLGALSEQVVAWKKPLESLVPAVTFARAHLLDILLILLVGLGVYLWRGGSAIASARVEDAQKGKTI